MYKVVNYESLGKIPVYNYKVVNPRTSFEESSLPVINQRYSKKTYADVHNRDSLYKSISMQNIQPIDYTAIKARKMERNNEIKNQMNEEAERRIIENSVYRGNSPKKQLLTKYASNHDSDNINSNVQDYLNSYKKIRETNDYYPNDRLDLKNYMSRSLSESNIPTQMTTPYGNYDSMSNSFARKRLVTSHLKRPIYNRSFDKDDYLKQLREQMDSDNKRKKEEYLKHIDFKKEHHLDYKDKTDISNRGNSINSYKYLGSYKVNNIHPMQDLNNSTINSVNAELDQQARNNILTNQTHPANSNLTSPNKNITPDILSSMTSAAKPKEIVPQVPTQSRSKNGIIRRNNSNFRPIPQDINIHHPSSEFKLSNLKNEILSDTLKQLNQSELIHYVNKEVKMRSDEWDWLKSSEFLEKEKTAPIVDSLLEINKHLVIMNGIVQNENEQLKKEIESLRQKQIEQKEEYELENKRKFITKDNSKDFMIRMKKFNDEDIDK